MSRENVEAVRRAFEATNRANMRDPQALEAVASEYWASDVVIEEDPEFPGAGVYRGVPAVSRRFAEYYEMLGNLDLDVDRVLDGADGRVVAVFRAAGRGGQSGVPVERELAFALRVRDGRATHIRLYLDVAEALEAVGLRE